MTCRVSFAFGLCAVLAFAAATKASATPQNTPSIRLLPTDREAERVRVLKDGFENHLTDDVPAGYAELKSVVQDLIVRQLDAAPAISDGMLLEQLRKVIGQTWDGTPEEGLYVRSSTRWDPVSKQRVWAVAYVVWLGSHGPGGTGAVIDSYVWDEGRTRLAGRQDSDFSGYDLKLDWLASRSDQVGLLVHGRLSGSNGLGTSKASVYFCDPRGVHAVWQSPTLLGVTAVARGEVIALRHAQPCEGAASSACAWTYEVYALGDEALEHPTVTLVSRETRREF